MEAQHLIVPAAVALGVSAVSTPAVARLATALGVLDKPNARKVSQRTDVPLLGGVAVALGFAAGLAAALPQFAASVSTQRLMGLMAGSLLVLATGAYDDRFGLSAGPKFVVQIAAAFIAISSGFRIDHATEPISQTYYEFAPWLIWVVTSVWIVGITNAVNLIDGLDGLATGVAVIIGATLTVIAAQGGHPLSICVGVALVGTLLGFLPHNFPPARIFLGDTGSLFVGYVLALLALESYQRATVVTFVVPLLALAVPLLDTFLSIVRRLRRGTNPFAADRLHMHHRMLASHGSIRRAVLQFYLLTGCFGLIALSFTRLSGLYAALFLAAVAVLTLRLLWNLGALSFRPGGDAPRELSPAVEESEP
jgi:UDP-GlcNAc:undecaprenyl-phosphate/decaprenyl-phosphate GlcNAc-1-phosphate transferase